jgi:D-alanyl-D-alanine carboxypeptidase (penicillin-binding protein 5/6)
MPEHRRMVYRRRRIAVGAAALLVVGAGVYLPTTLLAPVHAVTAVELPQQSREPVDVALAWPGVAASAIGAVGYAGVLDSAGSTEPLPIASISKVITVLAALEARPLEVGQPGPTITFDADDAALYAKYRAVQGTVVAMPAGSSLSQLDTMKIVLVVSANNYAEAFAEWAFGSHEAFVSGVDAWLSAHGLDRTTIVEPTGIDPRNVSTSADLVELAKLAVADPMVSSIVGLPSVSYSGIGSFENTNDLLGIDGVDGIKTGTLPQAGACLLFAADYPVGGSTVTVVGVVLGSANHASLFPAVRGLLDSAEAGFSEVILASAGQPFAEYTTRWGDSARAVATVDASAVVWSEAEVDGSLTAPALRLAAKGSDAGSVVFTAGEQRITVPLELDHAIDDPGPWWRLGHPLDAFGSAN